MPNWKKVALSGSNVSFNQVSSSAAFSLSSGSINSTLNFQSNIDVDTGTEVIAQIPGARKAGFLDYVAQSGSNYRAGQITIVTDGSITQLAEYSTQDIGNTSTIKFSSSYANSTISLIAACSTNDWDVRTIVRAI